jgi:hypothetical protein
MTLGGFLNEMTLGEGSCQIARAAWYSSTIWCLPDSTGTPRMTRLARRRGAAFT